jgi:hypothetical protein
MNIFLAVCFSPALAAVLVILSMYVADSGSGE